MLVGDSTITITFCETAEHHIGMERYSSESADPHSKFGLNLDDLRLASSKYREDGCDVKIYNLEEVLRKNIPNLIPSKDENLPCVMVVRGGVDAMLKKYDLTSRDMYKEQCKVAWDKQFYNPKLGKIQNSKSRYNVCYSDKSHPPNIERRRGRNIAFSEVRCLNIIRNELPNYFGNKTKNLFAEGNNYYNTRDCGIPYHTDKERNLVIGCRFGAEMPLHFKWFEKGNDYKDIEIQEAYIGLKLRHGDLYAMTSEATGDESLEHNYILKHAAGNQNFMKKIKN